MRMGCAGAGGDAIFSVIYAVRDAKIAIIVDKRNAPTSSPAFYSAVGNAPALFRQLACFVRFFQMAFAGFLGSQVAHLHTQIGGQNIATGAHIVAVAVAAVEMDDDPVGNRHIN